MHVAMTLFAQFEARLALAEDVLAWPVGASGVARALAMMDLDLEVTREMRANDEQQREGVLSWAAILSIGANAGLPPVACANAVLTLADWGLVQLVGRLSSDPVIPGSGALRLTHSGRTVLGLAPSRPSPSVGVPAPEALASRPAPSAWTVLHGEHMEPLLVAAEQLVGALRMPVRVTPDPERLDRLCGLLAVALVDDGGGVVDGTGLPADLAPELLGGLLARTSRARGPRVLLLKDPEAVRIAAVVSGARLQWVAPEGRASENGGRHAARLTTALLGAHPGSTVADACGVPSTRLARPMQVSVSWDDLDVPESTSQRFKLAMMHACSRMRNVRGRSGSGRVGGYRLLLSGLPGTGKSMSSAAVATSLGRPLIKLDLSNVLSKWLGETEKLLGEVFDLAEISGAVLVLDEAEALFRQRDSGPGGSSGLATSVAYLLGRLDEFAGALVATTNRVEDLDEAFFRRFDDYIILPMPDIATRRRLWARALKDQDVDTRDLAARFTLSGGLIEGASIRARAWSGEMETPLTLPLVLASLALELEKSRMPSPEVFDAPGGDEARRLLGR